MSETTLVRYESGMHWEIYTGNLRSVVEDERTSTMAALVRANCSNDTERKVADSVDHVATTTVRTTDP